jgi:hypothetical protein
MTTQKGPTDRIERRKSATTYRADQHEMLEEFARLMGANVNAVRLSDNAVDDAHGGAPRAVPLVIAVDQDAKQRSTVDDFPKSIAKASLEPTEVWSALRNNELPVPTFDAHEHRPFSGAPVRKPRRWGKASVILTLLFVAGTGGVLGAWALEAAPGAKAPSPAYAAADPSAEVSPALPKAIASGDGSASIMSTDQVGERSEINLAGREDRSSEPLRQVTSPSAAPLSSAAPLAATGPDPAHADTPIAISPPPAAPSIPPADGQASTSAPTPSAGASNPAAEPKEVKAGLGRLGGAALDDGGSSTGPIHSPKAAEAATLPQPSRPPVPVARPLFQASVSGARQPPAHKTDTAPKTPSKSTDRAPAPKVRTTTDGPTQSLDVAAAPAADAATAPEVAKAPKETTTADSVLQFVPNLFDRGVNAVRSLVGNATRGS